MFKILIKNTLILAFPIIALGQDFSYAHRKFEVENKPNIEIKTKDSTEPLKITNISLQEKIDNNFENFQSFENSIKPSNQFLNLFGVGGFADQRLKKSSFQLWDTFEKEMSNQIGNKKLNGSDINNTYNGSLKTLGN